MIRFLGLFELCVLSAIGATLTCAGCQRGGDTAEKTAPPTPEESFDLILTTFRRGVETGAGGVMAGGVSHKDGGYSAITINNTVTHELIPPAKQGDDYRATITVTSRSRYSIKRGSPGADEASREDEAKNKAAASGDALAEPGAEMDPGAMTTAGSTTPTRGGFRDTKAEAPIGRPDEDVRTYDLVHRGGRWELLTKIDEKNDPAAKMAFERALGMQ
jgi:hypothetical protein